jgi:hypothetical protein
MRLSDSALWLAMFAQSILRTPGSKLANPGQKSPAIVPGETGEIPKRHRNYDFVTSIVSDLEPEGSSSPDRFTESWRFSRRKSIV